MIERKLKITKSNLPKGGGGGTLAPPGGGGGGGGGTPGGGGGGGTGAKGGGGGTPTSPLGKGEDGTFGVFVEISNDCKKLVINSSADITQA